MMFCFYFKLCVYLTRELISYPFLRYFNRMNYNGKERLDGKLALVTGSNTGIGKAAALLLAERGAEVIMACRDQEKAACAVNEIKSQFPDAKVSARKLDLASNRSVKEFADEFVSSVPKLDILVNNAGVYLPKFALTEDGYETHFGVNYLSHFYLTLLLLEKLKASENAKVVNVAAMGHRLTHIHFEDLFLTKKFHVEVAYSQAKLAQVMFTRELAIRCPQVKTYSLHPGVVDTDIPRHFRDDLGGRMFKFSIVKTALEGAQTILYCLLDEKANRESGLYYQDLQIATNSSYVEQAELRKRLWNQSIALLNLPEDSVLRKY